MMSPSTIVRRLVTVLSGLGCFVVATGCYSYQQTVPGAVSSGASVRAHLSGEGMRELEGSFGEPRPTVEGEVLQAGDGHLLLLARTGMSTGYSGRHPLNQRLRIEQQEILRLEERRLEPARTAALTAAMTAGLAALVIHFFQGGTSGGPVPVPPPGPEQSANASVAGPR